MNVFKILNLNMYKKYVYMYIFLTSIYDTYREPCIQFSSFFIQWKSFYQTNLYIILQNSKNVSILKLARKRYHGKN